MEKVNKQGIDIIAQLMGWEIDGERYAKVDSEGRRISVEWLNYADDWNLLMMVVDKIESLPVKDGGVNDWYCVVIDRNIVLRDTYHCVISINGQTIIDASGKDRIKVVYDCVLRFIKQYQPL